MEDELCALRAEVETLKESIAQRERKAWDRAREMRVTSGCPDFCGEVDGQTMSHETFEEWKRDSAAESEANRQASKGEK
jgi:hypothetical protein